MPLPKRFPKVGKTGGEKRVLVNRYQVEKRLGSGKFGTAWLVTDLKCKDDKEKQKVLKEIPVGDLQPDETVEAVREARLLSSLDHPGIVHFHDSFIEAGYFCIVTEFCEGGDLDQQVLRCRKEQKTIPEAQVVEWIIQLLLAIQYMHDRRVMHRDIKSTNVFLRNNRIKIGDFGISRILMGTTDMASTFVGTPYYMSPEVLKHVGYNSKSDVWSVGCLLYDLVCLQHAFEGDSLMGVMFKIIEGNLPEWPDAYSEQLHDVFKRIMVKDPAVRPSASQVLQIPFITNQMQMLKNTIMEKHHSKTQKDSINLESQQLITAMKKTRRLQTLEEESEQLKCKNMSPRERMRLHKQQKADKEAARIKAASHQQLVENSRKYEEIRQTMNPYETHVSPVWSGGELSESRPQSRISDLPLASRPFTARIVPVEPESDSGSEDEHLSRTEGASQWLTHTISTVKPLTVPPNSPFNSAPFEDRPITPMKNQMIYDVQNSSLDFKDGIPEDSQLAETFYSQFDDEFDSGEDEGGTLVVEEDEDVEDLLNYMQLNLDQADTFGGVTLADDTQAGAFGPIARETKIKNLRTEAIRNLGEEEFHIAYDYLKQARYGSGNMREEKYIMRGLAQIISQPNHGFIVDQLLFLECQANIAL